MRLSRGLPRAVCWGRLASCFCLFVNISGLSGPCTYIDLGVDFLTSTVGGGALDDCGLLPAAQFCFVRPPVSSVVEQLSDAAAGRRPFYACACMRHAAAYYCEDLVIYHAPIIAAISCSSVAQGSYGLLVNLVIGHQYLRMAAAALNPAQLIDLAKCDTRLISLLTEFGVAPTMMALMGEQGLDGVGMLGGIADKREDF